MYECPRFEWCEAQLCPIDPDWKRRTMFKDERICHYLAEVSKEHAANHYLHRSDGWLYLKASEEMPAMRDAFPVLDTRLEQSSKTNTRLPLIEVVLEADDD